MTYVNYKEGRAKEDLTACAAGADNELVKTALLLRKCAEDALRCWGPEKALGAGKW